MQLTNLPLEVLVVEVVVLVELVEELGQLLGPLEVVHVDVRVLGRGALVVLGPRPHRDRDQIVPETRRRSMLQPPSVSVTILHD